MQIDLKKRLRPANGETLKLLAVQSANVLEKVRNSALQPEDTKQPPIFSSTKLMQLCGIERSRYQYLLQQKRLPQGTSRGNGRTREFSLAETKAWISFCRESAGKPASAQGVVISTTNFKGGATKTTTTISLAQGLNLLYGLKVLVIDLDTQGSLTQLFGIIPDAHVEREQTAEALFEGEQSDLRYAVQHTYWPDLDLVAAGPALYNAEFFLPSKAKENPEFAFWDVLRSGLVPLRAEYDVILIDTPPSLSYTTINALMAADGIVVPIVPDPLDFASSAQFWNLFDDIVNALSSYGLEKDYQFLNIVLSKVENSSSTVPVRGWLSESYGNYVIPVEIPKTSVLGNANAELKSVYDVSDYAGSAQTYARAREAYDQLVEYVHGEIEEIWAEHNSGE
ncbi:ParA family protein [Paraburkholderia fungorum]|uniref:AAA family ATPase n=1 Tax=Paraburkholderia fungorum TaxID=134537 RepID=A0AAP5QGT7_9BURK|nr:AAA family ATPase [Paraburkholderia fungorum]MBU7442665.1 AAA family ATPase [Paraburkholderia fungorum]MDT8843991.1 AAA family ATPase [Paraburkholderia fungorum]